MKPEENQELESIGGVFPKNMRTNEINNEIDEVRKLEERIKQKDLRYNFGDSIYTVKINIDEAEMDQSNLLENMVNFNNKSKPKTKEGKAKKQNAFDSVNALYEGRELTLNALRSGIKGLKILTSRKMLQRLPIALAQVKAGNTSENLLNEIRQIIYSPYRAKKVTKNYILI